MRHFLRSIAYASLLCSSAFASTSSIQSADDITYEWLTSLENQQTGQVDHVPHFQEIFSHYKVGTLLEFGLGLSTKYFLDSCDKVISVEFVTHGCGPEPMKHYLRLYEECSNWLPISWFSGYIGDTAWAPFKYMGSEHVYKACSYQCSLHKDYSRVDGFYLKELDAFLANLVKCHQIKCVFVDPSLYLRGDLVTVSFDKIPVIVAHNTHCRQMGVSNDVYGYSRIVTPSNYEEIYISYGQGTTIWVKKEPAQETLIQVLKEYSARYKP